MRSWPSSCRLLSTLAIIACSSRQKADGDFVAPIAEMPLKAAFADAFVVGAAINDAQFTDATRAARS